MLPQQRFLPQLLFLWTGCCIVCLCLQLAQQQCCYHSVGVISSAETRTTQTLASDLCNIVAALLSRSPVSGGINCHNTSCTLQHVAGGDPGIVYHGISCEDDKSCSMFMHTATRLHMTSAGPRDCVLWDLL